MKKSTYFAISSILMVCIFILMCFTSIFFESSRKKYEEYLLTEYKNLPVFAPDKQKTANESDQPDMASIQNYFMAVDPELKRVPTERLKESFNQLKKIQKTSGTGQVKWENAPANTGGRTRAIMYDPTDPQLRKVWAGSVTGGLWYNNNVTDTNSIWQPVDDFWDNLSISCIISDPNKPNLFYVGTGESQTALKIYRESSGVGIGIWKSADAGKTWNLIPSTTNFKYITDISIRNENGKSVIFAGVMSGFYQWTQIKSSPSDGLYRSVDDGITWEQVLPLMDNKNPYTPNDIDIAVDGRIFVGTQRNLNGEGGSVVLYSDLGTSGSWTVFNDYVSIIKKDSQFPIPGRVAIATAPSDKNIVYALIASGFNNPSNNFDYFYGNYILRSDDRGKTWKTKPMPVDTANDAKRWATIAWHAMSIGVDPNQANNVIIGGLDLYKTSDGGNTWKMISDWRGSYVPEKKWVHADMHSVIFKSGSSNEVLFGTDGGIFMSLNATAVSPDFKEINKNYNTLQFYSGAIHPAVGSNEFMGGLQDNGTQWYHGSPMTKNTSVSGGDGAYCFFDDTGFRISSVYYNLYYFMSNTFYNGYDQMYGTGIFINPCDYDRLNKTLYANAVTYAGNYAENLVLISGIPTNPSGRLVNLKTANLVPFSSVKVSPFSAKNSTTLFTGTQSGKLYRVKNAQYTPEVKEIGSSKFPTANISSIDIGENENVLLVTFSNYGVSSVWESRNGGTTWTEKEGNLPDIPVRWAIYHPQNSDLVMLATEIGIWSTDNIKAGSVTWKPETDGFANVRVDMLCKRNSDNKVLAATHGRGLFWTTWPSLPFISVEKLTDYRLVIFPNPTNDIVNIRFENQTNDDVQIRLIDLHGKILFNDFQPGFSGKYSGKIDVSNFSHGTYLLEISKGTWKKTEKLIVE